MDQQQQQGDKNLTVFVGPWGGNGGTVWDDGIYHGVREIKLVYDHCIDSISVVYDKNGKPARSEKHGGVGGNKTSEIKLQYPDEYLTGVSGYYCPVVHVGTHVIRSMTFKSNKQVYGPYGVEQGTPFTFSVNGGRIVGMNGRSGWYLDSIGFHLSRPKSTKMINKLRKKINWLTKIVA
ncbi:Jacalin-related lectin 19 [Cardamine amara subsp. amara]|uniref:Jacalin-related lectin 19 n=1 Tax=Cardamine amara subsp. amara TaxID=228776 RepID=A0ABD0ZS17_CARAN